MGYDGLQNLEYFFNSRRLTYPTPMPQLKLDTAVGWVRHKYLADYSI